MQGDDRVVLMLYAHPNRTHTKSLFHHKAEVLLVWGLAQVGEGGNKRVEMPENVAHTDGKGW